MSKIKDLYAVAENIDDLKPVEPHKYDKSFYLAVQETDKQRIVKQVMERALKSEALKPWLASNAEYSEGVNDDGLKEIYFENFTELCEEVAQGNLDEYIEEQALDITDAEYTELIDRIRDELANELAEYEHECIQDYIMDSKYSLDSMREKKGEC